MLSDKKVRSQSLFYRILFSVVCCLTGIGLILSFVMYYNYFDVDLALFEQSTLLNLYNIIFVLVFIICLVVLLFKKLFSYASNEVSGYSLPLIFVNSFCGLFTFAYGTMLFYDSIRSAEGINFVKLFVCLFALASSVYFIIQIFNVTPSAKQLVIFGMLFMIFCIFILFTVHYTSSEILLTSPVRTGALLSFISMMLFIMSEVRYHIGMHSKSMYISFGIACAFYSIVTAFPKLVLTLLSHQGFEFSTNSILYAIEVFVGVYALIRLSYFCGKDKYSIENKQILAVKIEDQPISSENDEENSTDDKQFEPEQTQSEEKPEEKEEADVVGEEISLKEDPEKEEPSSNEENDLPEDIGFVGGNEGEFQLDDYDSAEDISEDDFDEVDTVPFENTGIEDSIKEAMDEAPDDLGEVIDYEQIRNETLDDVMKSKQLYAMLADTVNIFDKDDDDDDDDIDDDFMQVLGEIKKSNSTEKKSEKKNKEKFRFVKKV